MAHVNHTHVKKAGTCGSANLVDHSSPSLARSLRAALCFSSSLSFSLLASSAQTHKSFTVCQSLSCMNRRRRCRAVKKKKKRLFIITHVAVLHGSDVRPQAAVCGSQHSFHARLQLIQCHGKVSEVIHLEVNRGVSNQVNQ